jgi:glycosyltransferase involved in cell wall biosynthesis
MIFSYSYEGHYARDLANGMQTAGVEVGFISLSGATQPRWVAAANATDFSTGFDSKSFFSKLLSVIRIINEFKPDIIQTHLFLGGVIGVLSGKLAGAPVVLTRHHIDEHYQAGTLIHRFIDRISAKSALHVVVCSNAAKDWLIKEESQRESHITVINQGFNFDELKVTPEMIASTRASLGLQPQNFNILCIARYSKSKGQAYLLEAIEVLKDTHPKLRVIFMGAGDSDWLKDLVVTKNLEQMTEIHGSRTDVLACIAVADLVVHPSLADSFSQLVIEAQSIGTAFIATDIAAAREQIIDGVTGIIVPPRDSNAIADAIHRIIMEPEISLRMREYAPPHVRRSFPASRMVSEEIHCLSRFI